MEKLWKKKTPADAAMIKHLCDALKIGPTIANLLIQRGIKTYDEAKTFFCPSINQLYDPFLMKDMDKGVARLEQAIANKERILLYGDYDVDGTTGVALMFSYITQVLFNNTDSSFIGYYIPDRNSEGYGISFQGIDYAAEHNYSLIIAIDCGIKANDKVAYARKKNIDFIICDHHVQGDLPEAVAVLDPERHDCSYPCKYLSGCAVAFKLLQGYVKKKQLAAEDLFQYLDLVAVSIASDIVPVLDENRVLLYAGLQKINGSPCKGLAAIIKVAGMEGATFTVEDVVFKIGPRINAAGRIQSGNTAVDLLVSGDDALAMELGQEINSFNAERKDIDKTITDEALAIIENNEELQKRKSTVLYKENWHKGVIGIVASRLIEVYYKPTIVLCHSNGMISGSARSIENFDLYKAIEQCAPLLERFGGHKYAAGITLKVENMEAFSRMFEEVVSETITPEMLVPTIEVDAEIKISDINDNFVHMLKRFEPFGPENMRPVFCSRSLTDNNTAMLVGKKGNHLKLSVADAYNPSKMITAIAFGFAHVYPYIKQGKTFDICYSIEENTFNGKTTIQLKIKDIKINK